MQTNWQLDHSFRAVLDIFGKGLNLPAPLDIQWPKCFQLQGGFAPLTPWRCGLCPQIPALAMVPPNHWPFPPPMILAPRAPPLILTSLRLCSEQPRRSICGQWCIVSWRRKLYADFFSLRWTRRCIVFNTDRHVSFSSSLQFNVRRPPIIENCRVLFWDTH